MYCITNLRKEFSLVQLTFKNHYTYTDLWLVTLLNRCFGNVGQAWAITITDLKCLWIMHGESNCWGMCTCKNLDMWQYEWRCLLALSLQCCLWLFLFSFLLSSSEPPFSLLCIVVSEGYSVGFCICYKNFQECDDPITVVLTTDLCRACSDSPQ